jgi:hypothetical protein
MFPSAFWGADIDTFGRVMQDPSRRGEGYLFYCYAGINGSPVLGALVAGQAALALETCDEKAVVKDVMAFIRRAYEPQGVVVPEPLQVGGGGAAAVLAAALAQCMHASGRNKAAVMPCASVIPNCLPACLTHQQARLCSQAAISPRSSPWHGPPAAGPEASHALPAGGGDPLGQRPTVLRLLLPPCCGLPGARGL